MKKGGFRTAYFWLNVITGLRFILAVQFIVILAGQLEQKSPRMPYDLYIIFCFICLSDFIDGWLARLLKVESCFGGILDVSADCFFIVLSLLTFNIFKILPFWFTILVVVDFIGFVITSRRLIYIKSLKNDILVFDRLGRSAAILFYIMPVITCLAIGNPGFNNVLNLAMYTGALLAGISLTARCIACFPKNKNNKEVY